MLMDVNDFRIDIGRADKGRTFVRVTHIPTGAESAVVGIGNRTPNELATELLRRLASNIDDQGNAS